jgi:glucose-1-phosphatase
MQPKFLYFDLGKVLVDFSVEQMLRQIGDAAEIGAEKVKAAILGDGLMRRHESGQLSDREFYEAFCTATGARPSYDALARAAREIFSLHLPMLPLVAQLRQAGHRMGILSNTCAVHWDYCLDQYRMLAQNFDVYALSYRIKATKPAVAIFEAAAELAGVLPEEIFFVDDLAENVAGARAHNFDAVQFTTAAALAEELRRRGIRFNY